LECAKLCFGGGQKPPRRKKVGIHRGAGTHSGRNHMKRYDIGRLFQRRVLPLKGNKIRSLENANASDRKRPKEIPTMRGKVPLNMGKAE